MYRMPSTFAALVMLLNSLCMASDPNPIALWPNGAPGGIADAGEEKTRVTAQGERVISNVHKPSITPYLPNPEVSIAAAVIIAPGRWTSRIVVGPRRT